MDQVYLILATAKKNEMKHDTNDAKRSEKLGKAAAVNIEEKRTCSREQIAAARTKQHEGVMESKRYVYIHIYGNVCMRACDSWGMSHRSNEVHMIDCRSGASNNN